MFNLPEVGNNVVTHIHFNESLNFLPNAKVEASALRIALLLRQVLNNCLDIAPELPPLLWHLL